MRKTVIVCDRCGKETTLDNSMTFQGKLDVTNRTDESNMNQTLFGGGCRSEHMETIEVCKECGDFIIGKATYLIHDAIRFKRSAMEAHEKNERMKK